MESLNKIAQQEQGLRKAIWWLIKELRQESEATDSEKVVFVIRENSHFSPAEQRRSITFLEKEGLLEILEARLAENLDRHKILEIQGFFDKYTPQPIRFTLKLNIGAFKSLYGAYKAFFKEEEGAVALSFDEISGILHFNDKSIRFHPQSNSFSILKALLSSKRSSLYEIGDPMSFDEINNEICFDHSIEPIAKKAFYSAQKHINKKAAQYLSAPEFTILKDSNLSINRKYVLSENW